jgi:peptidoglycan hydrolase-like protein with peptidoglycan-binding domain/endo-alpha-1,4-polygalactosaminidase (GH114 family)
MPFEVDSARPTTAPRITRAADVESTPVDTAAPAPALAAADAPERIRADDITVRDSRGGAQAAERSRTVRTTVRDGGLGSVPTLRRGDSGEHVERLQTQLNGLGYDCGEADGEFGRKTERALKSFQSDNDLVDDGVAGPRTHAALRAQAPSATSPVDPTAPVAPTAPTAPVAPSADPARSTLAGALNKGYQYLIGNDFPGGARSLKDAGLKGAAILDPGGATAAGVASLKAAGVTPYAYNNAFQTQPGEGVPGGVRILERDNQWGENVPDFANRKWQDRRIGEAKEVARMGFAGVMLDNVPRAEHNPRAAADYIKRMAVEAREASGNPSFGIILQNGHDLVKQHPWLVDEGYVASVQKEDVSYRVNGAGTGTGVKVSSGERADIASTVRDLRDRFPGMPLIAVDYPANGTQADESLRRAREMGFHTSHVATGDGQLSQISRRTRLVNPLEE